MSTDFWSSYFPLPKRARAEIIAESGNIARIDRDYPSCVCGARDEFGCQALKEFNCRCLAPMMALLPTEGGNTMKYCVDCRFYSNSGFLARCAHESSERGIDKVTGERTPNWSCSSQRDDPEACGPNGEWFEPRDEERRAA